MDALRRQKLRHLLETRFGGDRGRFVQASGLTKGRLSQLLQDKYPFRDRAARGLEERLSLPPGYFDEMDQRTLAWATAFDALPADAKDQWERLLAALTPPTK